MKTTDFTLLLSCKKGKTNDSFSFKCFKERLNERRIEDDLTVKERRERRRETKQKMNESELSVNPQDSFYLSLIFLIQIDALF